MASEPTTQAVGTEDTQFKLGSFDLGPDLATGEDSVMMPDSSPAGEVRRHPTGDMDVYATGIRGGPIQVRVQVQSASHKKLEQELWEFRQGKKPTIHSTGTVKVGEGTYNIKDGVVNDGPMGQTFGGGNVTDPVFYIECREIAPA